ncbi:unnamed protein product [Phaeothamnion confervicola]
MSAAGMQWNDNFVPEVEKRMSKDARILVSCQMGGRSAMAQQVLEDAGFTNVVNIAGGYGAWAQDNSLPVER